MFSVQIAERIGKSRIPSFKKFKSVSQERIEVDSIYFDSLEEKEQSKFQLKFK